MGRPSRVCGLAGLGYAALLLACAGGLVRAGDSWVHPKTGASVADLSRLDPSLERIDVDHATLAYRGADGTLFAWVRECRGSREARRLAAALLAEWKADVRRIEDRVVAGAPAALLVASGDGVGLVAITRAGPGCSDDWILVRRTAAPERRALLDRLLDRWVASFDPGPQERRGE